ncbi:MAG: UDP binding domain-containing protein, partial [Alphaproteobacteria bacterium]
SGLSDLAPVARLAEDAVPWLKPEAVLAILSQVPPGFTRALSRQRGARGDRLLAEERLFCQVETLIIGRAVERALAPERLMVGCADPARPLPPGYRAFLESFHCPILAMRYESAELAKIAVNCFLAAAVTTTNTLAELCERTGADWAEIAPALRLDARIGPSAYLTPGLGLAGGNLERDLATVRRLAGEHGSDAGIVEAWLRASAHRRDWVVRTLHDEVLARRSEPTIALLGLAYKENTESTRNSPALALLDAFPGVRFRAYDPAVPASVAAHARTEQARDMWDACRGADAVVLMTPWPAFRELSPRELARTLAGRIVVDPLSVLDGALCQAVGLHYFTLGDGPRRAAA